jgi:predicted nucleic acid-binding protein
MGARRLAAAYVDASAVVKLFKSEPETAVLMKELRQWPVWVSSELLAVEARCTARRLGSEALLDRADEVLAHIDLVRYSRAIGDTAGSAFEPALRALDAIHLATALAVRERLGIMVAYDSDLGKAAVNRGLPVASPAS